ncbi:bifunctional UDP-N-acetylmuramoyl-tripeptide:D-alanyl-D-alanine ligase/alanine racemase [Crocinitomix catalasitica]|uniref:bifunctional UDP-N-acetylmuramoyl-tripeptide:D-alanyl-D-alanine ligase/alanine racemase n=1 Tax=Crocinitomix catalasitica TaxID=184607 RepID=UPI00055B1F30|nr:bifunctional UDP-N-acetylmuramoyl-tripeptide:D-alanyl-D-alanine ligase/alanine racemase [Crocinitomix catalasitica]
MKLDLTIDQICQLLQAKFIANSNISKSFKIQQIIIDTRIPTLSKNSLFISLKGQKTEGSLYHTDFAQKGGQIILTNKAIDNSSLAQIIYSNPLEALQKIAAFHRGKFNIPIIGITGSNGKTTVKEWLYYVLKSHFNIVRSPKSYNSQIGVALSVLEINKSHNLAIIEAGISQVGEMDKLEAIIRPTIGVFTGLGSAHDEGFPENNKADEKYKLFKNVSLLIEKSNHEFSVIDKINDKSIIYSLEQDSKKKCTLNSIDEQFTYTIPFNSEAAKSNAALVYLIGKEMGIDIETLSQNLTQIPPISMRLETIPGSNKNNIINDAYNLDNNSLNVAIQYLASNQSDKKNVLIIGESNHDATNTILKHLRSLLDNLTYTDIIYIGAKENILDFDFITQQRNSADEFLQNPINFNDANILITGTRTSKLERIVNYFSEKSHITRLEINLSAIRHNIHFLKSKLPTKTKLLAMVKAHSYGVGLVEISTFLTKEKLDYLGVAYVDEGVEIRKGNVNLPIIVMNTESNAFDNLIQYKLEPSIYSLSQLNQFIHQLILYGIKNYPIHIKIETGMNRLGFKLDEIQDLIALLKNQPEVYIKSVFSHLSVAGNPNETKFTEAQFESFDQISNLINEQVGYQFLRHILNTDGILNHANGHYEMVRTGIGLFGLIPNESNLQNALSLHSKISQIKNVQKGDSIGYGRSFIVDKPMRIGIVPVGYADGLRRSLSKGVWQFYINGQFAPIVGFICMDMCMVDLTDITAQEGDDIEIFGDNNSILDLSKKLDTIPYEVISGISSRVHRVYIEE